MAKSNDHTRQNQETSKTSSAPKAENVKYPRYRTNYSRKIKPSKGETNNEPSQTIPDQSLSIRELLMHHSRGINVDVTEYKEQYFDTELPMFTDLSEMDAERERLENERQELDRKFKSGKLFKTRAQMIEEKRERQKLEAKKKALENLEENPDSYQKFIEWQKAQNNDQQKTQKNP